MLPLIIILCIVAVILIVYAVGTNTNNILSLRQTTFKFIAAVLGVVLLGIAIYLQVISTVALFESPLLV